MRIIARGAVQEVIAGLIQIGVKKIALSAIDKATIVSTTAVQNTARATTAAAAAPAAAAVSLASFGANSIAAIAGIAAVVAAVSIFNKREFGGNVSAGKTFLVGERGPELFTPGQSGGITPNNQLGGGGGNVNISFDITAPDTGGVEALIDGQRSQIMEMIQEAFSENAINSPIG